MNLHILENPFKEVCASSQELKNDENSLLNNTLTVSGDSSQCKTRL